MRISHKHRFVFLAIPRTGSTTVRNVLDDYSDIKSIHISEITDGFPFYHHISARELKNIFERRGWEWSDYKKFCMIRNPYDRVVSLYYHRLKMESNIMKNRGVIGNSIGNVKDIVKPVNTFKDYLMHINPRNRLPTSLKAFICDDNGNFLVDDVLMYEKLNEDLPNYLDNLGINITAEDIPHLNASQNRSAYRDYFDEDTKKRVSELYAYEISRFGYNF
ncbi:MAG: sulfotransferase family 2 domain-containing protein [Bacteroidales bacterium]|nr:sulfotransferase family 2 domain-containing protein [Bacteroidales bacterium]